MRKFRGFRTHAQILAVSLALTALAPAPIIGSPAVAAPPRPAARSAEDPAGPGSAPLGSTQYPIPSGALFVAPGGLDSAPGTEAAPLRTIAQAVARAAAGATVVLRAGSYTEDVFIPAAKPITIQSYAGETVWLDGSAVITGWQADGDTFWATLPARFDSSASHTVGSDAGGFVNPNHPMAAHPDQVFLGGEPLRQRPVEVRPGPGEFVADYDRGRLIIGVDPTGREVRASVLSRAIVASAPVTLRGFGVRRYATSLPQMATVFLGGEAGGARLENLVVEANATQGISASTPQVLIDRVTSRDNGMVGIHAAYADGLVVRDSVLSGNNVERFNPTPAAAAIKIGRSRGVTVTGNRIEGNHGVDGIWLDESVVGFGIGRNQISGDGPNAIQVELSDTGVVAGNDLRGHRRGITIYNSGRVTVANNLIRDTEVWDIGLTQDERRQATHPVGRDPRQPVPDPTCPWQLDTITVINNVFARSNESSNPGFQFYGLDKVTKVPLDRMSVTVDGNVFSTPGGKLSERMVGWGGDDNVTVTLYSTPAALAKAKNSTWANRLVIAPLPTALELDRLSDAAVALPEDVAALLRQPVGRRLIGLPGQ